MSALEKFTEFGAVFVRPEFDQVKLPEDITILSSEQLAEQFSRLTAWSDYIASQLAFAQIDERAALRHAELLENRKMLERSNASVKGERITYVKAEVSLDPEVVEAHDVHEEKHAYRKLVEMLLANHERDITLVSREITRRTQDQRALRKDYGV